MKPIGPQHIFILFAISGLLAACEDPLNPKSYEVLPKLVVHSNFTAGKPVEVMVSRTRPVLAPDMPLVVEMATVELLQNGLLVETLTEIPGGLGGKSVFRTKDYLPEANVPYTLRVAAEGFKTVSARSIIPAPVKLQNLEMVDWSEQVLGNTRTYKMQVALEIEDPAAGDKFYHLKFRQQILTWRAVGTDTLLTKQEQVPLNIVEGNTLPLERSFFEGGVLLPEDKATPSVQRLVFDLELKTPLQSDQKLGRMLVEFRTVTIYSNLDYGQGVFAGYNTAVDSLLIQ